MSVLFKDISILSMTKKHGFIQKGSVLVENGKIVFVGEKLPEGVSAERVISGEGKLLLPGLVNAHTHLPMAALGAMPTIIPCKRGCLSMFSP